MRIIPSTMATQHPDNAGIPFWHHQEFVSTSEEIMEAYICFSKLGIGEYNWDWEGKFVDEAVTDRLLAKYYGFFKKHPLGKKSFLTFRIPNPRVEKGFRLARAFMVVVTSSQMAKSLGFDHPPIFETILPLTETAEEVVEIQLAFRELLGLKHPLLGMKDSLDNIEVIPLFEQVDKIMDSGRLLKRYLSLYRKNFGRKPPYLRPYCARSDPALNSGLVPTLLALKVALSDYLTLESEEEVPLYPMLGTGSLPFRGGLSPDNLDSSLAEYRGVKTLTIQSAFRYDYPQFAVKEAVERINKDLPKTRAEPVSDKVIRLVREAVPIFQGFYRETVEDIADMVNLISLKVEKRRERMLHIGLFGYSRGVGKVRLPRAIPYTGALYSLGIPPEFIGTGRGIKEAKKEGIWEQVAPLYRYLENDLIRAGYYLNKENLERLKRKKSCFEGIARDILEIEKEYGMELGPKEEEHVNHKQITDDILSRFEDGKDISKLIVYGGKIRKSLG